MVASALGAASVTSGTVLGVDAMPTQGNLVSEFTVAYNFWTNRVNGRRAVQSVAPLGRPCPDPEDFFLGTVEERRQCIQHFTLASCVANSCELDAQGKSTGCVYSLNLLAGSAVAILDAAAGGKRGSCDPDVVMVPLKTSVASQATIAQALICTVAALMHLA